MPSNKRLAQAINAIKAAQLRITDEQCKAMSKVAADGAWRVTASLVQAHIWRTILIAVAVAVAVSLLLLIGAFGAGYWFHGSQQLVAGVSAGQQECSEQQGGTLCYIPVWTKLPPHTPRRIGRHEARHCLALGFDAEPVPVPTVAMPPRAPARATTKSIG